MGSDAIIVTGTHTGAAASMKDLEVAANASDRPIVVGSGATPETLPDLLTHADAVIVGSAIKRDGDWRSDLCPDRIRKFVDARG